MGISSLAACHIKFITLIVTSFICSWSIIFFSLSVLLRGLNVGSYKQRHTIAQGLYFSGAEDLREIRPMSPPTGATNAGGVGQNRHFRQITGYISKTVQDRRMVSIKVE